jgi:hypothetical protein
MDHHTAEELQKEDRFRLVKKLSYDDIIPFIFEYIRKRNIASYLFFILNILLLFFLLAVTVRILFFSGYRWFNLLRYGLLGTVLLPLVLAPIHEGVHGLVYFLAGARRIKFGADLSQFIFYVTAHRYVVGRHTFFPVAFTPFFIINALLILLYLISPPLLAWSILITLFAHSTMCIGDFAMVSFFFEHHAEKILTFDDLNEKTSYFYEKLEG